MMARTDIVVSPQARGVLRRLRTTVAAATEEAHVALQSLPDAERPRLAEQPNPLPPKVSRAILEDRYDGLLGTPGDEWSTDLWSRGQAVFDELIEGVVRSGWTPGEDLPNEIGLVADELWELVRKHIVDRVDEMGSAR